MFNNLDLQSDMTIGDSMQRLLKYGHTFSIFLRDHNPTQWSAFFGGKINGGVIGTDLCLVVPDECRGVFDKGGPFAILGKGERYFYVQAQDRN